METTKAPRRSSRPNSSRRRAPRPSSTPRQRSIVRDAPSSSPFQWDSDDASLARLEEIPLDWDAALPPSDDLDSFDDFSDGDADPYLAAPVWVPMSGPGSRSRHIRRNVPARGWALAGEELRLSGMCGPVRLVARSDGRLDVL